jgi:DNA-binding NarL/FixJ family response regulator
MSRQVKTERQGAAIRLIVGDAGFYVPAIESAVVADNRISLVATADSCSGMMELIESERPHVALVALSLAYRGKPNDLETLGLVEAVASGHTGVKVLMLSEGDEDEQGAHAIRAGAYGYVEKRRLDGPTLCDAIAIVARGMIVIPPRARAQVTPSGDAGKPLLSGRQHEDLEHLARGLSNSEIASELGMSTPTVKTHLRAIYDRLEVTNRVAAVAAGVELGLLFLR